MSNPSVIMPNEDDYIDYSRICSGEEVKELSPIVLEQLHQDMHDIEAGMKTIKPIINGEK